MPRTTPRETDAIGFRWRQIEDMVVVSWVAEEVPDDLGAEATRLLAQADSFTRMPHAGRFLEQAARTSDTIEVSGDQADLYRISVDLKRDHGW